MEQIERIRKLNRSEMQKELEAIREWNIRLGSVLAIYRNLRENYEFRMRYDEAGKFFIREMELKRRYEETSPRCKLKNLFRLKWRINQIGFLEENNIVEIVAKNWIRRNFSLSGIYYHLSRYGESVIRPTLFGIGIVLLSLFLWMTQPDPSRDFSIYNIKIPEIYNVTVSGITKTNIACL